MLKILDIGKDGREALSLASILAGDYTVISCPDPDQALERIEGEAPSAILLDLDGRDEEGLKLLGRLAGMATDTPIIVMSAEVCPRRVVRAIRLGAADYIAKPIDLAELKAALRSIIAPPARSPFLGSGATIQKVISLINSYARFDFPVLILGESGTGKDLAAQAIHAASRRSSGPMVARNCAAFPESLIESELFGAASGAFTGAVERPGAFELAKGGTLFLDEIGEACLPVQAKLLRVIESDELWRLGDRRSRSVDIRLVCATSRDLKAAVAAGQFREDLLYRIDTLIVELPPLRARREDIPELADHFVRKAAGARKGFSSGAYARLQAGDWPGNVRQLKNVVHRALVLSGDRETIGEEDIVLD
jgi:DNA-binding NtrC family response regulator